MDIRRFFGKKLLKNKLSYGIIYVSLKYLLERAERVERLAAMKIMGGCV